MRNLLDVNVWLTLLDDGHVHHPAVLRWWEKLHEGEAAFCRVTQMSLLRLLTNSRVMGEKVLNPAGAWRFYRKTCEDDRVVFLAEPESLEPLWESHMRDSRSSSNAWTDAYLAAFAKGHGIRLATLDEGFKHFSGLEWLLLPPEENA